MTRKQIDRSHQSRTEDEQNTLTWEKRRPALLFTLFKEVQNSKCRLELLYLYEEEDDDATGECKITFYFNRPSGNTITSLELECSEAEHTEAYTKVMEAIRKEKVDQDAKDQKAVNDAWNSLTPAQQRKLITQHLEQS